jgi:hypothetical protein
MSFFLEKTLQLRDDGVQWNRTVEKGSSQALAKAQGWFGGKGDQKATSS